MSDVIPGGDVMAPWCDECGAEHAPCDGPVDYRELVDQLADSAEFDKERRAIRSTVEVRAASEDGYTQMLNLRVDHDKDRRAYMAVLSTTDEMVHGPFTRVKFHLDLPSIRLVNEPTARYSASKLQPLFDQVIRRLEGETVLIAKALGDIK